MSMNNNNNNNNCAQTQIKSLDLNFNNWGSPIGTTDRESMERITPANIDEYTKVIKDGWMVILYNKKIKGDSMLGSSSQAYIHTNLLSLIWRNEYTMNYKCTRGLEGVRQHNIQKVCGSDYTIDEGVISTGYYDVLFFFLNEENYCTLIAIHIKSIEDIIARGEQPKYIKFLDTSLRFNGLYLNESPMVIDINKNIELGNTKVSIGSNWFNNKTTELSLSHSIEQPEFAHKLFDYQKKTINFCLNNEKELKSYKYTMRNDVSIGNVIVNTKDPFKPFFENINNNDPRNTITFYGSIIADAVGLGKTVQATVISLMNPRDKSDLGIDVAKKTIRRRINNMLSEVEIDVFKIKIKATLVLCPGRLCYQWIEDMQKRLTVKKFNEIKKCVICDFKEYIKLSYYDLINADFVIVSFELFNDKKYNNHIDTKFKEMDNKMNNYYMERTRTDCLDFYNDCRKEIIECIDNSEKMCEMKNVIFNLFDYQRIVLDEAHEIVNGENSKSNNMVEVLKSMSSKYRLALTASPFAFTNSFDEIFSFITKYPYYRPYKIVSISTHIQHLLMCKNTQESTNAENNIPAHTESVKFLKFSQIERTTYESHHATGNSKDETFLRQLCCYFKFAEIVGNESFCKTLDDLEKCLTEKYRLEFKKASENYELEECKFNRIDVALRNKIKRKQYKLLSQTTKGVSIVKTEFKEYSKHVVLNAIQCFFNDDVEIAETDDIIVGQNETTLTISDLNQEEIYKKLGTTFEIFVSQDETLKNLRERVIEQEDKTKKAKNNAMRCESQLTFFKNASDVVRNCEAKDEKCPICLDSIKKEKIGVTICGHIGCYDCLKASQKEYHKCPYCRKDLKGDEILTVVSEDVSMDGNVKKLINDVGTKIANILLYLTGCDSSDRIIIFSQWNKILTLLFDRLTNYNIECVQCVGSVSEQNAAINAFKNNKVKIILLSSECSASGVNLTNANKIILVEPYKGTTTQRKNIESQAIGRACRIGQTRNVEVIRFVIEDTIESQIYEDIHRDFTESNTDIVMMDEVDDNTTNTFAKMLMGCDETTTTTTTTTSSRSNNKKKSQGKRRQ